MATIVKNARVAGLLYLSLVIVGPLRLIYIPNKLIVDGNAAATASNILAHEWLFRLGIVSDVVGGTLLIFTVLALYRLFKDVDVHHAVLVVLFGGVMPAAIYFLNVANDLAALMLVRGADFLNVFDKPQRDALAMFFLQLHYQEIVAAEFLWGLWLFPLAVLVYRSGFLPRLLGVWLVLNGIAYVAASVTGILWPQHAGLVFRLGSPARLAEIATMLWLLFLRAKEKPATVAAA